MAKLELATIDTDAGVVRIGPLRFIHTSGPDGHASIVVRGLPVGHGALMGHFVCGEDEWEDFLSTALKVARLAGGREEA